MFNWCVLEVAVKGCLRFIWDQETAEFHGCYEGWLKRYRVQDFGARGCEFS